MYYLKQKGGGKLQHFNIEIYGGKQDDDPEGVKILLEEIQVALSHRNLFWLDKSRVVLVLIESSATDLTGNPVVTIVVATNDSNRGRIVASVLAEMTARSVELRLITDVYGE